MHKFLALFASFVGGALTTVVMMLVVVFALQVSGATLETTLAMHTLPAVLALVVGYAVFKATAFDANQFTVAVFGAALPHFTMATGIAALSTQLL